MINSRNRSKLLKSNSQLREENSVNLNSSNDDSFMEVFKSYKDKQIATNTRNTKTKNHDLWSDEDISPSSNKLNADVRECGTLMNDLQNSNTVNNDSTHNSLESKKPDISSLLEDNNILHCPICLKSNKFDQSSGFLLHLKNCASKNQLSTEQLIKAIELQDKQTTERIALGLPVIKKEKQNIKKNLFRKGPVDSNLELAIALSTSLRESEMLIKLKASETLLEAGLEHEAMSQCRQLEDFGFMSSKSTEIQAQRSARSKNNRTTILFTRSQEERERIITEKIAMILIDSDSEPQSSDMVTNSYFHLLKSHYLLTLRDEHATLWRKSYQLDKLTNEECYYVANLSRFVSPCKIKVGAKLKHVSQIPCRPASPGRKNESSNLKELAAFFEPKQNFVFRDQFKKFDQVKESRNNIDSKMATDWKCLINERFMSDLIIYAKNERSIYAHKLVFHARCRSILSETIKEEENGKCTEMLMWFEYCYESVIAFLEFIYTGCPPKLENLNENQVANLNSICARYGFVELKNSIEHQTARDEMFECGETSEPETYQKLSPWEKFLYQHPEESPKINTEEKENSFSQEDMQIQDTVDVSSPEMFTKEKEMSPDSPEREGHCEILSKVESNKDEMDVFDSLISRSFTSEKEFANERNSRVSENSTEESSSETENIICERNRMIIDDILSDLCSPPMKQIDSKKFLKKHDDLQANENIIFDNFYEHRLSQTSLDGQKEDVKKEVICLSSSDDEQDDIFTQEEIDAIQLSSKIRSQTTLNYFKRKSCPSLDECMPRRTKRRSYDRDKEAESSDDELTEGKLKRTKTVRKLKKQKILLSQTMSFSASDSDASLYKLDMAVSSNYCDDSFESDTERKNDEVKHVNSHDSESRHSSIRIDDSEHFTLDKLTKNNLSRECKRNDSPKASDESPYVSPVWDGFEYANDECYGMEFLSEPSSSNNFHVPLTVTSSPNIRTQRNSLSNTKREESSSSTDHRESIKDPSFGSFSINESLLNRIETDYLTERAKTQEAKTTKPADGVRIMKKRSKSDTSVVPKARKCTDVTSCPDYANMSSPKLKKALDNYGIKTGLSRPKAVKLLKYIYEQLHPDEGESESKTQLEKTKKPVRRRQKENSTYTKQLKKPVHDISSDSDSVGTPVQSNIVLEESIMEDENDDCISDEDNMALKSVSIDSAFRDLLKEDKVFHKQILMYEPIWIEPLKQRLKEKGVKCGMNGLKDYLDEKCITFRTKRQKVFRRKKRKQNDPNSQTHSNQN